jgi:hypothetical protein
MIEFSKVKCQKGTILLYNNETARSLKASTMIIQRADMLHERNKDQYPKYVIK